MFVKYGLKTLYRTPLKTGLFVVLLFTVTILLILGMSMWLTAEGSLKSADKAFSTIGVVEYRDPEQPSTDYHRFNYDYTPVIESSYIQSFDQRTYLAGLAEEVSLSKYLKGGLYSANSVIEFVPLEEMDDEQSVRVKIGQVLYSPAPDLEEGAVTILKFSKEVIANLENGKKYVSCVYESQNPAGEKVYVANHLWINQSMLTLGYSLVPETVAMEVTDSNFYETEDGRMWDDLAKMYTNSSHTLTILLTDDFESILAFHQHKALITHGQPMSKEDYLAGNRVCLISNDLASSNGLELGDSISITFSTHSFMVFDNEVRTGVSIDHRKISGQESFEIIGFYKVVEKIPGPYGLSPDTVLIPRQSISYWPDDYITYDNHISFRLPNGKVEEFLDDVGKYQLPGLKFTFYDQGYSKAVGALTTMQKTGGLLAVICILTGFGVVVLFSLLFVAKQLPSIAIMYSLGTSRRKALGFLLTTVLIVSLLGAGGGGFAGYCLSEQVLAGVYTKNVERIAAASAFSGVYGNDTLADFQYITPHRFLTPFAVMAMVLLATLIVSGRFVVKIIRAEPMKVLTRKGG